MSQASFWFLGPLYDYDYLYSQVLLDVDCGRLSYDDSLISPTVRAAADVATNLAKGLTAEGESIYKPTLLEQTAYKYMQRKFNKNDVSSLEQNKTENPMHETYNKNCPNRPRSGRKDLNRTMSPHESLCTSMLRLVNRTTISKTDLEEAFCRDIDSFNAAFIVSFVCGIDYAPEGVELKL